MDNSTEVQAMFEQKETLRAHIDLIEITGPSAPDSYRSFVVHVKYTKAFLLCSIHSFSGTKGLHCFTFNLYTSQVFSICVNDDKKNDTSNRTCSGHRARAVFRWLKASRSHAEILSLVSL